MEKTIGQVKWFDALRGFGYIKAQDYDDIFVHLSAIEDAQIAYFDVGIKVRFIIRTDDKGKIYADELELLD